MHSTIRYGIFSLAVASILVTAMPIFAQETDEPDTFRERREEVRERMEQMQEERKATVDDRMATRSAEMTERMETRRTELQERLRDRIKNLLENMVRRMNAAIERLRNIAGRMETRTEILEARGINGDAAREALRTAYEELDAASALINNDFESILDETVDSEVPHERIRNLRSMFEEAALHIRAAREALREALSALKDALAHQNDVSEPEETTESAGTPLQVE